MLESERLKLLNKNGGYISVGVTEGGAIKNVIGVPWERTAHAYMMHVPDVYIAPEDLSDASTCELLSRFEINGFYVFTPISDFTFISGLFAIRDLCIFGNCSRYDLSFLAGFSECRLLRLRDMELDSLDFIFEARRDNKTIFTPYDCICLENCKVADTTRFSLEKVEFSEFIVYMPRGTNEKTLWRDVTAMVKIYGEYDPTEA